MVEARAPCGPEVGHTDTVVTKNINQLKAFAFLEIL